MQPRNRLIAQISLSNGLELYFYDRSREIAAGRWQVRLSVRMPIELRREYCAAGGCYPDEEADDFMRAVGGTVDFAVERQLSFVDGKQVEESLTMLKNEFLQTNAGYLATPGFAAKFVRKRYREWLEQDRLRRCYAQHLQTSGRTEP